LNLIHSVSFAGKCPHGITVYNSKIYVARLIAAIVTVISNYTVEKEFSTKCSGHLVSLSVDFLGYFALSCNNDNKIYIYDSNMHYTNKSVVFGNVFDARLDTDNKFAMCGGSNVKVYY
jgi:hypothetical protein